MLFPFVARKLKYTRRDFVLRLTKCNLNLNTSNCVDDSLGFFQLIWKSETNATRKIFSLFRTPEIFLLSCILYCVAYSFFVGFKFLVGMFGRGWCIIWKIFIQVSFEMFVCVRIIYNIKSKHWKNTKFSAT